MKSISGDGATLRAVVRGLHKRGRKLPTLQARVAVALLRELGSDGGQDATGEAPNLARLAARLEVNRATLHHALGALRRKGWLVESTEIVRVQRVELRTVRCMTLCLPDAAAAELAAVS
jgi:DNA-binding IclR family transcriptional regulator